MQKSDLLTLFAYNYWANQLLLKTAAKLSPEQFTAPAAGVSHGSLRSTFVHTLGAEWIWRMRCQEGSSPTALLSEQDFPTLDDLVQRWQTEERAMRAYLDSLQDADLARTLSYRRVSGTAAENILWQILAHVVNHGTQHRSEAAVILTRYGCSPGDVDMIWFFRSP
jgi:uncharacterized damage-inducible protein DinB